jgi:2,3-bisphosphoglycerate-dependent phosphoglycerate mutase
VTEAKLYITFMRHGRSRADDEQVCEGRYDSPLTEVGRDQVNRRARQWLEAGVKFDQIVASTLARARESAEIVGHVVGAPVELDPDWMEMDNGPLAGYPTMSPGYASPGRLFATRMRRWLVRARVSGIYMGARRGQCKA